MADIKKYKGAVFFDVDGTLIDERIGVSVPTEATRDAIARLRENGYLACVATGRAKCYLCDLQTEFDCYVTCNGAIVELDGEIYPQYMDDGKLRSLLSYLDENGFGFSFETNERCYVGAKKSKEFLNAMRASRIDTKSFTVTDNFEGLRFCKAMITFSDEAKYRALCEKFGTLNTNPTQDTVFISHGDCENDAKELADMINKKYGATTKIITDVGPVIGAHSGPGTLALFFVGKER